MSDPDIEVVHDSSERLWEGSPPAWRKAQLEMKPCYVKLLRTDVVETSFQKVIVPTVASQPIFRVPSQPLLLEKKSTPLSAPVVQEMKEMKIPLNSLPSPVQEIPSEIPSESASLPFHLDTDKMSEILSRCFSLPKLSQSVFMGLITEHRRDCASCDRLLALRGSSGDSKGCALLYQGANSMKIRLQSLDKEVMELTMQLQMSEEARAITDNLYEEKFEELQKENEEMRRTIAAMLRSKQEAPDKDINYPVGKTQPILKPTQRNYQTSCGFNLINMTALREALKKAQICRHGNLVLFEDSTEKDLLVSRLAFVCETCQSETLFFTSGYSSNTAAFTSNIAGLQSLGENGFNNLVEFVSHMPFSKRTEFVGPQITEANGLRNKVKLILGVDKFELTAWKDLGNEEVTESENDVVEEDDGVIDFVNEKDEESRLVCMEYLEPEVQLRYEMPSPDSRPITENMKLDYLRKNPKNSYKIFPELTKKIFRNTRPMPSLIHHKPKEFPITNRNEEIRRPLMNSSSSSVIVNNGPNNMNKFPTEAQRMQNPPMKLKPSKDLPPGSRILSIPPGTKILCSNICQSNPTETGLSPGVYRVIEPEKGEKILIIEPPNGSSRKRGPPMVSIVNTKEGEASTITPSPSRGGNSILLPRHPLPPPLKTNGIPTKAVSSPREEEEEENTLQPETDPLADPQEDPLEGLALRSEEEAIPKDDPDDTPPPFIKIGNVFSSSNGEGEEEENEVTVVEKDEESISSSSSPPPPSKRMKIES